MRIIRVLAGGFAELREAAKNARSDTVVRLQFIICMSMTVIVLWSRENMRILALQQLGN